MGAMSLLKVEMMRPVSGAGQNANRRAGRGGGEFWIPCCV